MEPRSIPEKNEPTLNRKDTLCEDDFLMMSDLGPTQGRTFTAFFCGTCSNGADSTNYERFFDGENVSATYDNTDGEKYITKLQMDGPGSGENDIHRLWMPYNKGSGIPYADTQGIAYGAGIDERIAHFIAVLKNQPGDDFVKNRQNVIQKAIEVVKLKYPEIENEQNKEKQFQDIQKALKDLLDPLRERFHPLRTKREQFTKELLDLNTEISKQSQPDPELLKKRDDLVILVSELTRFVTLNKLEEQLEGYAAYEKLKTDKSIKPITRVNIVGWSRGAAAAIKAASRMYTEGLGHIEVNLILLDPVPGGGLSDKENRVLTPNVKNCYVMYAVDERSSFFSTVIPDKHPECNFYATFLPGGHAQVAGDETDHAGKRIDGANLKDVGIISRTIIHQALHSFGTKLKKPNIGTLSKLIKHYENCKMNSTEYDLFLMAELPEELSKEQKAVFKKRSVIVKNDITKKPLFVQFDEKGEMTIILEGKELEEELKNIGLDGILKLDVKKGQPYDLKSTGWIYGPELSNLKLHDLDNMLKRHDSQSHNHINYYKEIAQRVPYTFNQQQGYEYGRKVINGNDQWVHDYLPDAIKKRNLHHDTEYLDNVHQQLVAVVNEAQKFVKDVFAYLNPKLQLNEILNPDEIYEGILAKIVEKKVEIQESLADADKKEDKDKSDLMKRGIYLLYRAISEELQTKIKPEDLKDLDHRFFNSMEGLEKYVHELIIAHIKKHNDFIKENMPEKIAQHNNLEEAKQREQLLNEFRRQIEVFDKEIHEEQKRQKIAQEEKRNQEKSATKIQKVIRGYKARKEIKQDRQWQTMQKEREEIRRQKEKEEQKASKPYLDELEQLIQEESKQALEAEKTATVLQSAIRGYQVREEVSKQKEAAIKIQAVVRRHKARKDLKEQKKAATTIQATFKRHKARKELKEKKNAAATLQSTIRGLNARKELKNQQTEQRHKLEEEAKKREQEEKIRQELEREEEIRKEREKQLKMEQQSRKEELATALQPAIRGYQVRKEYQENLKRNAAAEALKREQEDGAKKREQEEKIRQELEREEEIRKEREYQENLKRNAAEALKREQEDEAKKREQLAIENEEAKKIQDELANQRNEKDADRSPVHSIPLSLPVNSQDNTKEEVPSSFPIQPSDIGEANNTRREVPSVPPSPQVNSPGNTARDVPPPIPSYEDELLDFSEIPDEIISQKSPGFFSRHKGKIFGGIIGSILGAIAGAIPAALIITGIILLPFTFGGSAALIGIGAGIIIGGALIGGSAGVGVGALVDRRRQSKNDFQFGTPGLSQADIRSSLEKRRTSEAPMPKNQQRLSLDEQQPAPIKRADKLQINHTFLHTKVSEPRNRFLSKLKSLTKRNKVQ